MQPHAASTQASGATLTFTAVVTGDSGMPVWTLSGSAPELGRVVPVQGASTVYTPPVKVTAPITVTLTAQLNELTCAVTITVDPAPAIQVAGRVVNNLHRGLADAKVMVPGLPATTTDASGAFTIPGVTPPYDLHVSVANQYVVVYQGLHRLDPTAFLEVNGTMEPPYHASVTGQVSGAAAGHRVLVGFGSTDVVDLYADDENMNAWALADADGAYGIAVPLSAPESTGTLYALEYQEDGSGEAWPSGIRFPSAYAQFASRADVHLTAGTTATGQHLVLGTALGTSHATGTASYGAAAAYLDVDARFGQAWLPVGTVLMTGASFDVPTPETAEEVRVSLRSGTTAYGPYLEDWRSALPPDAAGVALSFDEGFPNPVSPPDGSVVTQLDTPFVWQVMGTPDVVYLVRFNGPIVLTLVTPARSQLTIPDLSGLGLSVPTSTSFRWAVTGTTASARVDDLAGPQTYKMRTSRCYWARSVDLGFQIP